MPEPKMLIRCVGCNKPIAEGAIKVGEIKIICKCGTVNTIKANQRDNQQYDGVIRMIPDEKE